MSQTRSSAAQTDTGSASCEPDMNILPPVYLLHTHLPLDELHDWEAKIPSLTYDIKEAQLIIGNIRKKKRAAFELRAEGLWTEDIDVAEAPPAKRRRTSSIIQSPNHGEEYIYVESSDSEHDGSKSNPSPISVLKPGPSGHTGAPEDAIPFVFPDLHDHVKVVNLGWLKDSFTRGHLLSLEPYTVYNARPVPRPKHTLKPVGGGKSHPVRATPDPPSTPPSHTKGQDTSPQAILERARAEAPSAPRQGYVPTHVAGRKFSDRRSHQSTQAPKTSPKLLRQTTSEHDTDSDSPLPDPPQWVKDKIAYCCQRSTPPNPPNAEFISLLDKIKHARILQQDEIGVRAYSTAIASISAYPHLLTSSREILRLPGCSDRIALLFREFKDSGTLAAVQDAEANAELQILDLFYNIWGVGPKTAQDFYDRGWRDLDDVVADGWSQLHKTQQAGLKFYDEFLLKIPRSEVESMASVIHSHAKHVRDSDVECIIVGGYRRGKQESGDVDVVLSHRNEEMTKNLATDVTESLYESGWVTHTLTLHETNTNRQQATLPFRTGGGGHGFDSLDKSFVVWQDPNYEDSSTSSDEDDDEDHKREVKRKKNPNPHRRVDIIISPWRTVGCAILGWSGATTFQRDIRRFAKKQRGWKFDSSGIRDRARGGNVIDLERPREGDEGDTWQDRERRVMEGLGIGYRPAEERCTG
jgi:DNA polymerase IV